MNSDWIYKVAEQGLFPGSSSGFVLKETHISWIILTEQYAFKIKKPVKFDFLDFSTLPLRKFYCEEEFLLNRRLAPRLYIGVLPVTDAGIGASEGKILDYALQMHRMDNRFEMDKLLSAGLANEHHMVEIAALLAPFHQKNRLPADHHYQPAEDIHDFSDLFALEQDLLAFLCPDASVLLRAWKKAVPAFLMAHTPHLEHRLAHGFWVDGHGDLHSRNIFLPPAGSPVIFDCIEFSAHFRQGDVLNELAFLCMDLEHYGREDLAEAFLEAYSKQWNCFERLEDDLLFTYFKAYRANVRLKVTLLGLRQHFDEEQAGMARSYWTLLKKYMLDLVGF